jgi:hypothetical protein
MFSKFLSSTAETFSVFAYFNPRLQTDIPCSYAPLTPRLCFFVLSYRIFRIAQTATDATNIKNPCDISASLPLRDNLF